MEVHAVRQTADANPVPMTMRTSGDELGRYLLMINHIHWHVLLCTPAIHEDVCLPHVFWAPGVQCLSTLVIALIF